MNYKEAIKVIDDMLVTYENTYKLINVGEAADAYYKFIDALNTAKYALQASLLNENNSEEVM